MLMFVVFVSVLLLSGSTIFGFLSTLRCPFYDNLKLFKDSPVVTRNRAAADKNKVGRIRQAKPGSSGEDTVANHKKWNRHEHTEQVLHDIQAKEAKVESTLPIITKERERKEFLDALKDKVIQQTIKEHIIIPDVPLKPSSSVSITAPAVKPVHLDVRKRKKKDLI
jgi:hypothetical protein